MIRSEEVFKIGQFNKPHGIHGELSFTFTDDIFDRSECEYLVCLVDGILVPFFIEEYRFRSETVALVKLEGIDTAEQARMLTNTEVYFPLKYVEEDEDEAAGNGQNPFIGYEIEDVTYGLLGKIKEVDTTTINTLFVVAGTRGGELLIPAREEFIIDLDEENKQMMMDLPEGLVNLERAETDTD